MRNEDNAYEWVIYLKKDGKVFVAHESITGDGGAGILSEEQRAKYLEFVFGEDWEERIKEFTSTDD